MPTTTNINVMQNINQSNKNITTSTTESNTSTSATTTTTSHHHRPHGGSIAQACAACKYQRRKCAPDCILAPYFPQDRQPQFLNAHRLFGVSNIIKIVRHLDPPAKDHAMRTIIFQSDARAADPIGGCYRIIRDLEHQISLAKAELEIVHHHLAICRAAASRQQAAPPHVQEDGGQFPTENDAAATAIDDMSSWSNYCMHGNGSENLSHAAQYYTCSFPHDHVRSLSVDDQCNHDDMKAILDQLSGDDDETNEDSKFDSHGNIVPSNNNSVLTEENNGGFKEDDGHFFYIEDQNDLKAAATFFTLTNCDI